MKAEMTRMNSVKQPQALQIGEERVHEAISYAELLRIVKIPAS